MRKICIVVLLCAGLFSGKARAMSVMPQMMLQGDTARVGIDDVASVSDVLSVKFNGKRIPVFSYQGVPTVLVGIALNQRPGMYDIVAILQNGKTISRMITVLERQKPQEALAVPQKLGGSTPSAENAALSYLASENAIIARLYTGTKAFWTMPFLYPLKNVSITDSYGFERLTGRYVIAHKGTDLRASIGTPVLAMNRGIVRLARSFKIYGNIVVIDHGLGVMTLYLHLSKIQVNVGEMVSRGQVIGLSGETGFAQGPHLHMSVHVGKVSVDPVQFLQLFGQ